MSKAIPLLSGPMETVLAFFPDIGQAIGLLAVLAVAAALAVLGAGVGGPAWRETDLAAGWGLAAAVFSLTGIVAAVTAGHAVAVLMVLAVAGLWRLRGRQEPAFLAGGWRAVALLAPALVVGAVQGPSRLADFEVGLWGAFRWLEGDRAVAETMVAIVPYLASRLSGAPVEQAGALANLILLAVFGLVLARLTADGQGVRRPGWGLIGAGLVVAVVGIPALDPRTILATGPETATAVLLALSALLAAAMLEAQVGGRQSDAIGLAWKAGLVIGGMATLEPGNGALAGLVLLAVGWQGWRHGRSASGWLVPLLVVALPAIVVALAQRLLPVGPLGGGVPSPAWQWPADSATWLRQGGHFVSLLLVCILAARRRQRGWSRLLAVAGFVAAADQLVLLATGAPLWAGNQRLGAMLTLTLVAWLGSCRHWAVPPAWVGRGLAIGVVVLPLAAAPLVRFDRQAPYPALRQIANQTGSILGAGDRVQVFSSTDLDLLLSMLRWSARGSGAVIEAGRAEPPGGATHVLLRGTDPNLGGPTGIVIADGQTALLRRTLEGWVVLRRWAEGTGDGPGRHGGRA